MADRSRIEWCDASWNPIRARRTIKINDTGGYPYTKVGWHCTHVSEGCRNCYAESFNRRLGTGLDYKPGHETDIEIFLDEKMLLAPLRWRKRPRKIFVGSMTDLFADFVQDEWLDRIWAVMALCPQHTFQLLTKRPERMREYFTRPRALGFDRGDAAFPPGDRSPFPNVWLGTSCEDQPAADERIPHLLAPPAAVRFLSLEPLLEPIDLRHVAPTDTGYINALCSSTGPHIDWVIVGGESGPHARPMHPDWARSLRDQCAAAGVAFYFKQWGAWKPYKVEPGGDLGGMIRAGKVDIAHLEHHTAAELCQRSFFRGDTYVERVGKKNAGRMLDGVEHNATPEPRP